MLHKKQKIHMDSSVNDVQNNIVDKLTIVQQLMLNDMPRHKAIVKSVADKDFSCILNASKYANILTINYNLKQLKAIAKYHKLRISGTKESLKKSIYNLLFYSYYATQIQKHHRGVTVKTYIKLHGPAFYKRDKCVNDVDFCTLDPVISIPYSQFFSFQDKDGFIYGYDIVSLNTLYAQNKNEVENPFNKKPIELDVFFDIMRFIKYSKMLKIDVAINYEKLEIVDDVKRLKMKVLTLFQHIDSLGNYTNFQWFMALDRIGLVKFCRELFDIWNYRAALSQETRLEICPPYGDPFRVSHINFNTIHSYSSLMVQKFAVSLIDEIVNKGITNDSKALGAYFVLSALTLVSDAAAIALPWLYESVHYV